MEFVNGKNMPNFGDLDVLPIVRVHLDSLVIGDSPRLCGGDFEHARTLAESDVPLPPLLVHRSTMRVIDGLHRLRAAELQGKREIDVRFVDGDEASSFVLAVEANIAHGLPLSLADRKAAATRIIGLYPQWSDRKIASVTGLSRTTISAVRVRPTDRERQLDTRIGLDGRRRPLDSAERRDAVERLLLKHPKASLRGIARRAGVSPETVRGMRVRLHASRDDGTSADSNAARAGYHGSSREQQAATNSVPALNGAAALTALRADPAFRSSESGRSLLRMMTVYRVLEEHHNKLVDHIPAHSLGWASEAARACADAWQQLAERIEQRRLASAPTEE
jgi:ParB-like chromosome segregation protein Spo0J